MTDEEIAEEYAENTRIVDENTKAGTDCISLVQDYEGNVINIHKRIKQTFLAGLKAGRLKWHDLRKDPNDLPRQDETFTTKVSIPVMVHPSCQFAEYYFDERKWFSKGEEVNAVAWCEIPLFEES